MYILCYNVQQTKTTEDMHNLENLESFKEELTAWERKNKPGFVSVMGMVLTAWLAIKLPHTASVLIPLLLFIITIPFIVQWLLPTNIKELRKKIKKLEGDHFDRENIV